MSDVPTSKQVVDTIIAEQVLLVQIAKLAEETVMYALRCILREPCLDTDESKLQTISAIVESLITKFPNGGYEDYRPHSATWRTGKHWSRIQIELKKTSNQQQ